MSVSPACLMIFISPSFMSFTVLFVLLMLIWVKLPLDKGDIFIIQKKTEAALADGRETVCGEVERGKGE